MKPVALIPARGGSKRIPRKNIADLNGKPLLAYPVTTCVTSELFSDVIVSTEDPEIAAVAQSYGASWDKRPEDLCGDLVPAIRVCHELLQRRFSENDRPEIFCMVYPIAVFLEPQDLHRSAEKMAHGDAVLGVSPYLIHPYKALVEVDGHLQALWPQLNAKQSQTFPEAYASNGTFCWVRTAVFMERPSFYPLKLCGHVIPNDRAVDIDTPEDLERARRIMRLREPS